jgi:hypothetical protein
MTTEKNGKKNSKLINHLKKINMEALKEIWQFVRQRKKFWLIPVITILILIGLLVVFGGGSAVAPFIYTLF